MRNDKDPSLQSRRDFIRQASCAAVGTIALKSTIRDLRLINRAVAQTGLSGYKALVCVFLAGGNDSNNWIVPTDTTTYDQYTAIRGNLALPLSSLHPLYSAGTTPYMDGDGHSYGFHPSCPDLQTLFGEDKLAVVMNTGTLVRPTTRAQYLANPSFYRPPQLFSHSDQVTQWQTSIPDQPPLTGWGGRVADLLHATANPSAGLSMSISVNGANTFEIGNLVSQYHVSTGGAVTLGGSLMASNSARILALRDILDVSMGTSSSINLQQRAFAGVLDNAIATGDLLNTNISATALDSYWTTPFPVNIPGTTTASTLAPQLKMIARLIQARGAFNMNRQIFFCSVGGYDTHTAQVTLGTTPNTTTGTHANLLAEVNSSLFAFQRAMEQLGVGNDVTAFTASDFARTLPTNSQGSDHGWGAHHIVIGGAVNGGAVYGHLPTFAINGPDDTGTGRWLPTIAVDQHAGTLAKWFGVDTANLNTIFPNLSRFAGTQYGTNIGFMA